MLAVGNYMNGTSARGGAYGFSLTSVKKMIEMKSQGGQMTLIDFIIFQYNENY